jgi:hypothetical protein
MPINNHLIHNGILTAAWQHVVDPSRSWQMGQIGGLAFFKIILSGMFLFAYQICKIKHGSNLHSHPIS